MSHSYDDFFKAAKKKTSGTGKRTNPNSSKKVKRKKRSRRQSVAKPPWMAFLFLVGFLATGWGYLNLDWVERHLGSIEIRGLGRVSAAEGEEKKDGSKSLNEETNSTSKKNKMENEDGKVNKWTDEDVKHFSKLNERKRELDRREAELDELERELQQQKEEIEARIRKLERIRLKIGKVLKDKVQIDEERVKRLVDFYSNMKPQQAAKIISSLNEDLAVEILGKMKKKNAADILNLLKPEKAQVLSEKFAGYKRR